MRQWSRFLSLHLRGRGCGPQTWKSLPTENEAVQHWPRMALRDPDALAAALSPQHVFLTARRNLPSGETVCGTPY